VIDKAFGEAETSYEYTVPGDRRGQAICLDGPPWDGDYGTVHGLFSGWISHGRFMCCLIPQVG
jgi:hypothetical protein